MSDLSGDEVDLIDRIYEASVIPSLWPEVLRHFAEQAASREGVMVATSRDQLRWLVSSPAAEKFVEQNYKFLGGMERTRRLLARNERAFVTDRDLFTEDELMRLPVYTEYLFPAGYGRGVATAISLPDETRIIFHAEGDYRDGLYGRREINRLNGLRQHLGRSAMISSRLAFEQARTAVETLAGLGYPSCAIAATGKVLVANSEFGVAGDQWATRMGDKIVLSDSDANSQLMDAIATMAVHRNVKSIALRPKDSVPASVLHVVPIRRSAHDLFSQAAAILVLTMASNDVTQETALIQALFDLTATEASVAARVAAGHTVEKIALADSKSVETVRYQLKNVLAKTGCRRQADLARLLVSLVPPRM